MLNFIKAMSQIDDTNDSRFRMFKRIPTKSGYDMSIQCSEFHYCFPQKTIALDLYEEFEIATLFENNFVFPRILNKFKRKLELEPYYDGQIFAFVPKDLVEDLYNFLNDNQIK